MTRGGVVDNPNRLTIGQRLRFLAKDSLLYGGAAAFNKAFALITFPLLARHFTVQAYGIIDFFTVLASLLTILFVFGQDTAVARFFYDHVDAEPRREVVSESLAFQLLVILALVPPAWLLADLLAPRLSDAPEAVVLLRLVLCQIPFLLLINFSQNILKWTFSRARFLVVSVGSTTCSVAALLLGILVYDIGVVGVIAVYLATQAAFSLLGLWFVRGWLIRPRRWAFLRPMLLFAAPYGIVATVSAFIPALERTLIAEYLGSRELGLFAAGAKVAMLISLPIAAFQIAWGPFSLAIHKERDAAETYNWVLKVFAVAILAWVLVLTALADPVIRLLAGAQYAGASIVVFGLALGFALEATGWITSIGIGLSKRSYLNLYAYGAFLAVSLVGIYGLLKVFGLVGVAWGAMLGHLAKTGLESWLAQRAYPMPWEYAGVVRLSLLTIGVGVLSQIATWTSGSSAGAAVAALGVLLVLACGYLLVFDREDRNRIRGVLSRALHARMPSNSSL